MSEEKVNGKVNGDDRLEPVIRVVVEMKGQSVSVSANCAPAITVRVLSEGIFTMGINAERKKNETLIQPVQPGAKILPIDRMRGN